MTELTWGTQPFDINTVKKTQIDKDTIPEPNSYLWIQERRYTVNPYPEPHEVPMIDWFSHKAWDDITSFRNIPAFKGQTGNKTEMKWIKLNWEKIEENWDGSVHVWGLSTYAITKDLSFPALSAAQIIAIAVGITIFMIFAVAVILIFMVVTGVVSPFPASIFIIVLILAGLLLLGIGFKGSKKGFSMGRGVK